MQALSSDKEFGRRLRYLRKLRGLTQTELADQVGVTYQQVQKYENGSNRVAASRLWQLSKALSVGVELFFLGLDDNGECDTDFGEIVSLVEDMDRAGSDNLRQLLG